MKSKPCCLKRTFFLFVQRKRVRVNEITSQRWIIKRWRSHRQHKFHLIEIERWQSHRWHFEMHVHDIHTTKNIQIRFSMHYKYETMRVGLCKWPLYYNATAFVDATVGEHEKVNPKQWLNFLPPRWSITQSNLSVLNSFLATDFRRKCVQKYRLQWFWRDFFYRSRSLQLVDCFVLKLDLIF